MPSPQAEALTAAYQRQQQAIVVHVIRHATGLWHEIDPRDIDRTWPVVAKSLAGVVDDGYASSRAQAVHYLRAHAEASGVNLLAGEVLQAGALNRDQLETALRVTGPVALKRATGAGMSPEQAAGAALTQVGGAAGRLVLTGGRATVARTVEASEQIAGWRRVIGGHACYFCAMLASRGAVYKSETRALFAGNSSHTYHDHCRCIPEPLYENEPEPADVIALRHAWLAAKARAEAGQTDVAAFRANYDPAMGAALVEHRAVEGVAAVTAARTAAAAAELTGLSDDDLTARMMTADEDELNRILAELDRREELETAAREADAKAEAKRQRDRDRRAQKKAEHDAAREAEFDRLVEGGEDPETAYAIAYGKDLAKERQLAAYRALKENGVPGANFERASSAAFRDELQQAMIAAESGTRGALFSHAAQEQNARAERNPGKYRPVTVESLFTGGETRAREYASEELRAWWDEHGRLTLADFRAQLLGGSVKHRTAGETWHQ